MNIARMFRACKLGDIETIKSLVEIKEVDVNFRDQFDSTPLYYACLCGHIDVVRFLLEHGAKCDVKTFDGERCVYGALTDDIRKMLLKEYKIISKKVIRRNDYDEFLRKSLEDQNIYENFYDVQFLVHQKKFKAHRYILMIRSKYFYRMFNSKWRKRKLIQINNDLVLPEAFKVLLNFIYTGILEFSLNYFESVQRLFKYCEMFDVYDLFESMTTDQMKTKSRHQNVTVFFECSINFQRLYYTTHKLLLLENNQNPDLVMNNQEEEEEQIPSDVIFQVGNIRFCCHRLFFARRSDYFAALFKDHFNESIQINKFDTDDDNDDDDRNPEQIPVFELQHTTPELFNKIIQFLYTNSTQLNLEQACELLLISDVYLIESLKRFCSQIIANNISKFNPIDIINLARMFQLPKLESTAIQFIAENLKKFIKQQDFQNLVLSDARAIKQRQETDSIDIIDDIRYYLTIKFKKNIQMELEYQIDLLLQSLGLEA